MGRAIAITALLTLACASESIHAAQAGSYHLIQGKLRIGFAVDAGRLILREIVGPDDRNWIVLSGRDTSIWRLDQVGAAGVTPCCDDRHIHPKGGGTYTISSPSVLASAWKTEAGDTRIAIVNISDSSRRIRLNLPFSGKEESIRKGAKIRTFDSDGLKSLLPLTSLAQEIEVPPCKSLILAISSP